MRTKYFLLAAIAGVALASCTSDDYIGQSPSPSEPSENAIAFGSGFNATTRSSEHFGADAANLLNKHFTVGGFKVAGTTPTKVFDNYVVNWEANTAGKTESNTSDWEYVGITAVAPASIAGNKQTIKYWDYSTDFYDFIAYSTGKADADATATAATVTDGNVGVTAIDYENKATAAYTIAGSRVDLAKCYIADMVTVKKANYQKEVNLTFRSLAAKVRMAIYETIPGYSVKDVKFYVDDATTLATGAAETQASLFTAGTDTKDHFYDKGTFTIFFPTTGSANESNSDYNIAHASFAAETTGKLTKQLFGNLQYGAEEANETAGDYYLGRTLDNASYAQNKDYTIMLPNEEGTVLELRIDYTLVSIDGSGEEIKIHGAKAFVPAQFAAWKPNYAYTYIFKISDNTNGWASTVDTDPAGLYPITFDATVIDTEEGKQSTITTVATPSITTYQLGHDVTKDEYEASKGDIYVVVMDNTATPAAPKTDIGTYGIVYEISNTTGNTTEKIEANVMDALNIQASATGDDITGFNGLVLTRNNLYYADVIPGVDGNDITVDPVHSAVRFTPESGKTYAFCYKVSTGTPKVVFTTESLADRPADWSLSNLWYVDPDGNTEATAFTPGIYYKKRYTNNNDVWGVKVIKVQ